MVQDTLQVKLKHAIKLIGAGAGLPSPGHYDEGSPEEFPTSLHITSLMNEICGDITHYDDHSNLSAGCWWTRKIAVRLDA